MMVLERPHRLARVALSGIGLVGGITVLGIFALTPDGTGLLQAVDSRAAGLLHVGRLQPNELTTQIGAPPVVMLAAAAVSLMLWQRRRGLIRNVSPLLVAAAAGLIAATAACLVRRPGPGHLGDLSASSGMSFPSVSASSLAALACCAIMITADRRCRSVAPMLAITVLPSIVRVVTATSWPLDEVVGLLLGWAVAGAAFRCDEVGGRRRSPARSRRFVTRVALAFAIVGSGTGAASFAATLRAPGNAAFDQRTVEWLRSNGIGPLVDRGESWWLWRHLPSSIDTITFLPAPPIDPASVDSRSRLGGGTQLPSPLAALFVPALPLEGQWSTAAVDPTGRIEIATTNIRADPAHPSVVVAVAWINSATTRIGLVAGTSQPGNGVGPSAGHVPAAALASLLAVFNSGYKMGDTPGGTLIEGRTTRTMVDGLATLAVRSDGTATVGEWGRDLTAAQGFVGLRQNLHLMVSGGVVVTGLATNASGWWGTVRNTLPTWRSGLGVTSAGDLVYVGGDHLTLGVLANALVRGGTVTAMELDIHRSMVAFNLFTHQPQLLGHKLLPAMPSSIDRYLRTDWRDFVMFTSRSSI